MKKNRFLFVAMLFAALSLGFVSCDDNKGNEPDDPQGEGGANTETPTPNDPYNGHAYVDLGLSVKWATCNVGADSVHHYGSYYAWGETTTKEAYTSENYTYAENPEVLPLDRDASAVNMGGEWRMPTNAEIQELIDGCAWATFTLKGVNGYIATSKTNAATIFFPAAGFYDGVNLTGAGAGVVLYSSTFNSDTNAFGFVVVSGVAAITTGSRFTGIPVRGVIK